MRKNRQHKKQGQVLLITVMLLAVALTIALTISYSSRVETQITKLKEEQKKALNAADAGVEKLLNSNETNITLSELGDDFSGIEGTAEAQTTQGKDFVTPLIAKDKQYTLYLTRYDPDSKTLSTNNDDYYNGSLTFYFGSEPGDCSSKTSPAIELTLISGSPASIQRWTMDPCGNIDGINKTAVTTGSYNYPQNNDLFPAVNFFYKQTSAITITGADKPKLLMIRSLFEATKVGVEGSVNLPIQGKIITSTATTQEGVTKKIRVFQSYPQIPSNFFVTQF